MITVALIRWFGRIPKKIHFCDMRTCEFCPKLGNTVRLSRGIIRIALRIDRQQAAALCLALRLTHRLQPLMEWRGIGSGSGSGSGS
jgi:hypothetical protein